MADSSPSNDWTSGPAKWAAVILLGVGAATGMTWSMLRPAPPAASPAPTATKFLGSEPPAPPSDTEAPRTTRRININSASRAELELLPGVGPAVAQRILDHRASHGPFRSVDDLDNVKGIGPRTIEKLRELISVE